MGIFEIIIHLAVVFLVPPLIPGIINKVKAVCAGRKGPPILQLYWDLAKLMRKGLVISRTTSWVFIAGPVIGLITAIAAALIVPGGSHSSPLHFSGDFILFAYMLALGRFFTASAALDTGSAFEGMGAAREVTFSTLAEPILFCCFLALAKLSESLTLSTMLVAAGSSNHAATTAIMILVALSLFVVLLVENCRIPFDDPNTHLELTMIHEVMVLDHSGPLFGLVLYGAAIKLFILSALVVGVLVQPLSAGILAGWGFLLLGVLLLAVVIGLIESGMARLKLTNIPKFLVAAFIVSIFAVVLALR